MSILTLTGVSKSFGGQKVLDGLTMAVSEHSVYGFLGKNGAGKPTNAAVHTVEADECEQFGGLRLDLRPGQAA